MKVIVPAADRTAGRRLAGRRRTKRVARNLAGAGYHPRQARFHREIVDAMTVFAELTKGVTIDREKLARWRNRIPVGRKAFES